MPQQKINFKGSLIDPHMPDCLKGRMHRAEWNQFVREMNLAIHDAQVSMCPAPYILLVFSSISIGLILLDMIFNGIFGSPQIGTLTITAFVILGMIGIFYVSMCRPSRTLEECVELICEHYSDEQREIYFFYRHHTQTRITDNRFYIEVFVAEAEQPPPPQPRSTPEERGVLMSIQEEEDRQMVLLEPAPTPNSRALVVPAPAPSPIPYPRALLPSLAPAPIPYSQSLVPAFAPAPMPYHSQAMITMPAPVHMTFDSHAMVTGQGPAYIPYDSQPMLAAQAPAHAPMTSDSQAMAPAQDSASMPSDSQFFLAAPVSQPTPLDSIVPISAVFGSIAPPPTHEDMAQAFECDSLLQSSETASTLLDSRAVFLAPGRVPAPAPLPPQPPAPFDSK